MPAQKKKPAVIKPIEIPQEFKDKVNHVKNRILFLSPSVMDGEERECRKDDFESLANTNIGVGGFGKVYKVRHKVSKNVFAIKVINKKKILEHDLVEQIKLEVKIMYKLHQDHILKLYNHYEDDDNFYLILQFCAKGQIYSLLKKEGRFNEKVAAQYLRECISAVQYLHSLNPPIIHRDIKPENILLDSNGVVKLADFGWSNHYEDENRRLTYCGTPEYLAPEMIKQSGHDKTLDVWNLGVLLFELLTGSPPFEGSSQNELFSNILSLKIKWPKGFSGIARDLISKLLKIDPKQRIPIDQITDHPWFKSIPQIRPVTTLTVPLDESNVTESKLTDKDYQVVSKPSVVNKEEAREENSRQSVLDKKLNKVKKQINSNEKIGNNESLDSARQESSRFTDAQQKLQKAKKENSDLKYDLQKKCNELEQRDKKILEMQDLVKELKQYSNHGINSSNTGSRAGSEYGSSTDLQVKQLQDEIQRLRSLNKDRDDILNQIGQKNQNLRETETRLKLTQNDYEIILNKNKQLEQLYKEVNEKNEDYEKKIQQLKDVQYKTQKDKELIELNLNQKIEILQYKLLNGTKEQVGVTVGENDGMESTFKELLKLCQGDLTEITKKLQYIVQNEKNEDKLRKELIDQGRKMNDLRAEHERTSFEMDQQNSEKLEQMQNRYEGKKKQDVKQFKEEIKLKDDKIKDLDRQIYRDKAFKEQAESVKRQMSELDEKLKNMKQDRDVVQHEKRILEEKVNKQNSEMTIMKDKLHAKYKP